MNHAVYYFFFFSLRFHGCNCLSNERFRARYIQLIRECIHVYCREKKKITIIITSPKLFYCYLLVANPRFRCAYRSSSCRGTIAVGIKTKTKKKKWNDHFVRLPRNQNRGKTHANGYTCRHGITYHRSTAASNTYCTAVGAGAPNKFSERKDFSRFEV